MRGPEIDGKGFVGQRAERIGGFRMFESGSPVGLCMGCDEVMTAQRFCPDCRMVNDALRAMYGDGPGDAGDPGEARQARALSQTASVFAGQERVDLGISENYAVPLESVGEAAVAVGTGLRHMVWASALTGAFIAVAVLAMVVAR
jgi:hypothetical protein